MATHVLLVGRVGLRPAVALRIVGVGPGLICLVAAPLSLLCSPHFVVEAPLLFLANNGIRLIDSLELGFGSCPRRVALVARAVRVVLLGQGVESLLNVGLRGGLADPQYLVVVLGSVDALDVFLLLMIVVEVSAGQRGEDSPGAPMQGAEVQAGVADSLSCWAHGSAGGFVDAKFSNRRGDGLQRVRVHSVQCDRAKA